MSAVIWALKPAIYTAARKPQLTIQPTPQPALILTRDGRGEDPPTVALTVPQPTLELS